MTQSEFVEAFRALSGMTKPNEGPFPWQWNLYQRFVAGDIPKSCNLPTGLGKTSVIHVWLLALATKPQLLPRRLVYVVNRRTVVDQTTNEVENLRKQLPTVPKITDALWGLCSQRPDKPDPEKDRPLAISTLRGQFADNREWSADPSRPAVICGTVDMIGSRLLFSGYGCGFKTRPLHAGFLGQDSLLVHDEAHLEPAFQKLLIDIETEQKRCGDFRPTRVMELTATSRGSGTVFELTPEEKNPPTVLPKPSKPIHYVWQRMKSKKGLRFFPENRSDVAKKIGALAVSRKDSGQAILVFVRTIDDVKTVQDALKKGRVPDEQIQTLTGTLRGLERDRLATEDAVFARFLPKPKVKGKEGTVFLICTSAGEVGVDISADHLACDLTTFDSMAQRLGRVNRRGEGAAEVDVVYETDPNPKPPSPAFESARWKTKELLERLPKCNWSEDKERREASPLALRDLNLTEDERQAAFAPPPTILPTSDILFDAWALTSIREKLPGRPHVEPYLHGLPNSWEVPEVHLGWREEVGRIVGPLLEAYSARELLEAFLLKPHELLRDNINRVHDRLKKLVADPKTAANANTPVWIVDEDDSVVVTTLGEIIEAGKDALASKTVLLPPSAGGLANGMLDPTSPTADDVSDEWRNENNERRRLRVWDDEECTVADQMRRICTIDTNSDADETDEEASGPRFWHWFELRAGGDDVGVKNSQFPVSLEVHTKDVVDHTRKIVANLRLTDELKAAILDAAQWHDLGKNRQLFQKVLGNFDPNVWLAKSGQKGGRVAEKYRHEFGSLIDACELAKGDMREFVLHIIATHHGRGRPHFPADEAFDPEKSHADAERVACETPRRFARMQRQYGRWGLAYLESLLRAADYAASANPSAFVKEGE